MPGSHRSASPLMSKVREAMHDPDCTAFLQWALPRLDLRWAGFRRVRTQVCKRLKRRMHLLGLPGFVAYRDRLEADPDEWRVVDDCCRITNARFFATGGCSRYSAIVSFLGSRAAGEEPAARRPMLVGGLCLGRGALHAQASVGSENRCRRSLVYRCDRYRRCRARTGS